MIECVPNDRKREATKYGTLTAATLAAFLTHAEPAGSVDVPSSATWKEGVQRLQQGVIYDDHESPLWYIQGSTNTWFTPATIPDPNKPDQINTPPLEIVIAQLK